MNLTTNPLISVVMPVHNALPFLDESITSILNQSLTDFEFVIFDDASSDGSLERFENGRFRTNEYIFTKPSSGSESQAVQTR